MKNIYEVFDEFEAAKNKQERMKVIGDNLSQALVDVLKMTYHPGFQWYVKELPEEYHPPIRNELPGISDAQLSTQVRKLYLFRMGELTADKLTEQKRKELLLQILESVEPREAEVIMGIFRKDQGVKGLDYNFIKEAFPQLLP